MVRIGPRAKQRQGLIYILSDTFDSARGLSLWRPDALKARASVDSDFNDMLSLVRKIDFNQKLEQNNKFILW